MDNFDFDQAEGLRRMLASAQPQIVTCVSAGTHHDRTTLLINLATTLARNGNNVLVLDACASVQGVAAKLSVPRGATLTEISATRQALPQTVQRLAQGFGVVRLARSMHELEQIDSVQRDRCSAAFSALARASDIVLVDAEAEQVGALPLAALADGEILVQVTNTPESVKNAYSIIKNLNEQLGRRPFSILVSGASDHAAQLLFANLAQVAKRYLAIRLIPMGAVPSDNDLRRATRLGRAVVDAFPLASASAAFKRLAHRYASQAQLRPAAVAAPMLIPSEISSRAVSYGL